MPFLVCLILLRDISVLCCIWYLRVFTFTHKWWLLIERCLLSRCWTHPLIFNRVQWKTIDSDGIKHNVWQHHEGTISICMTLQAHGQHRKNPNTHRELRDISTLTQALFIQMLNILLNFPGNLTSPNVLGKQTGLNGSRWTLPLNAWCKHSYLQFDVDLWTHLSCYLPPSPIIDGGTNTLILKVWRERFTAN